jgi:hypothetical protein
MGSQIHLGYYIVSIGNNSLKTAGLWGGGGGRLVSCDKIMAQTINVSFVKHRESFFGS